LALGNFGYNWIGNVIVVAAIHNTNTMFDSNLHVYLEIWQSDTTRAYGF
jgi:hypothetical protein